MRERAVVMEQDLLNKAIIASSSHLLISTDTNGIVTFLNKAAEAALGYKMEEVVGQHTPMLWHDEAEVVARAKQLSKELNRDIQPGFDAFVAKCDEQGSDSGEWTFIRKDGSCFPVKLTATSVRDESNTVVGYLGVIEDLTEYKRTSRQLDESRSLFELVVKSLPDFIFVKDSQFRFVQVNEAFMKIYPEEMQDKVIGYTTLESYDSDEAQAFLAMDRKALEEGYSETEESILFPDGRRRVLFTQKIRFADSKGEHFILGIARDITERERLIKHLQESNDDLQKFAYVASHDLKSPLRAINNLSNWLLEDASEQLDEKNQQRLKTICQRVSHMECLLNDLLDYSRSTHHELDDSITVNTKDLVNGVVNDLLNIPERMNIIIDDSLQEIQLPTMPLKQIFHNLIDNAIKHHDSPNGSIKIAGKSQDKHYEFSVSDDGPGIPPEYQDKIFEMFQTLNPRDKVEGSGMGLALVRKLIKRHGGHITVSSNDGQGASFIFTWPKY